MQAILRISPSGVSVKDRNVIPSCGPHRGRRENTTSIILVVDLSLQTLRCLGNLAISGLLGTVRNAGLTSLQCTLKYF
jgi:hypothetical protein